MYLSVVVVCYFFDSSLIFNLLSGNDFTLCSCLIHLLDKRWQRLMWLVPVALKLKVLFVMATLHKAHSSIAASSV